MNNNPNQKDDNLFLPNFCDVNTVFFGIIVTELLVFVLVLVPLGQKGVDWDEVKTHLITNLAMTSLFVQWITLSSMALLCAIRRWLAQLEHNIMAGFISYLIILLVTYVISEIAWQVASLETNLSEIASHQFILLKKIVISTVISVLILGYLYQRRLIEKSVAILSYLIVLMLTLIISEWPTDQMISSTQAMSHQLFLWRNMGMSAIISAVALRYFYIQYLWKKEIEVNANAHAQALQARIRPHFLFNSMNTIASLIRFKPKLAEQVVEDFADLFRASLSDVKTAVTFQEEITWCRQYLRIEALRLGERLQMLWEIDSVPEDALLPPLCLQPLLENAIYHGIQPLPEGGTIRIIGRFEKHHIQLDIENPFAETQSKHQGNRIAQDNIHQRLRLFYGKQAKLSVLQTPESYHVNLTFPYIQDICD
jgi:two-component system, LytTR family, sensor histidine kinase AlgZ